MKLGGNHKHATAHFCGGALLLFFLDGAMRARDPLSLCLGQSDILRLLLRRVRGLNLYFLLLFSLQVSWRAVGGTWGHPPPSFRYVSLTCEGMVGSAKTAGGRASFLSGSKTFFSFSPHQITLVGFFRAKSEQSPKNP